MTFCWYWNEDSKWILWNWYAWSLVTSCNSIISFFSLKLKQFQKKGSRPNNSPKKTKTAEGTPEKTTDSCLIEDCANSIDVPSATSKTLDSVGLCSKLYLYICLSILIFQVKSLNVPFFHVSDRKSIFSMLFWIILDMYTVYWYTKTSETESNLFQIGVDFCDEQLNMLVMNGANISWRSLSNILFVSWYWVMSQALPDQRKST